MTTAIRCALLAWLVLSCGACDHSPVAWRLTPPQPPGTPPQAFDLQWQGVDENGLPANPLWGAPAQSVSGLPPGNSPTCIQSPQSCTNQHIVIDPAPTPSLCRIGVATGVAGPQAAHVDWTVASYYGKLRPSLPPISDDNDFNFIFLPTDPNGRSQFNGLTAKNNQLPWDESSLYMELELASPEIVDRFSLAWWTRFGKDAKDVVSPGPEANASQVRDAAEMDIDDVWTPNNRLPNAVLIGLLGVDCEHGCRSELHPVYVMAVEVDPTPTNDRWEIFARNWGDGGSCSSFNHELTARALAIHLPPPPGATTNAIKEAHFARSALGGHADDIRQPTFTRDAAGSGLIVTFDLPPAALKGLEELSLTVDWGTAQGRPVASISARPGAPPPPPPLAPTNAEQAPTTHPLCGEARTESAYIICAVNNAPAAVRDQTRQDVLQALARKDAPAKDVGPAAPLDLTVRPYGASLRPPPEAPQKLQDIATPRVTLLWSALCKAYEGQGQPLPLFKGRDVSGMCRAVKSAKR